MQIPSILRAIQGVAAYDATTAHLARVTSVESLVGQEWEAADPVRRAALEDGLLELDKCLAQELFARGDLDGAEARARSALQRSSDDFLMSFVLAHIVLAQGRYRDGWPLMVDALDDNFWLRENELDPRRRWGAEAIDGRRLLVRLTDGFGDQIMMARFVPMLLERGADVTVLCAPQLVRLFGCLGANACSEISAWGHTWTRSPDLPRLLGIEVENLPGSPYLSAPPANLPEGVRIGFATRGNPLNTNDCYRSLPQSQAERLRSLSGAISLLPEDTGARDFQETAEMIAALDLVISVDTSIANLAGAMGKPVWILLPQYATDWRWMRGRSDSPWYPSARLFRQQRPGDWATVLDEVLGELNA